LRLIAILSIVVASTFLGDAAVARAQATAVPGSSPAATAVATLTPQQEIDFRYFERGVEAGKERAALQDTVMLAGGVVIGIVVAVVLQLGQLLLHRPATTASSVERPRLPTTFRTASTNSVGNKTVWAPAPGRRFRLLRYRMVVTGNAAIGGGGAIVNIGLSDDLLPLPQLHAVFVPGTATPAAAPLYDSGWVELGDGLRSENVGQNLNLTLSADITSGVVWCSVAGTEE
jgi:hypothetical protein